MRKAPRLLINYSLVHEAVEGGRLDPVITLGGLDESAAEKGKEQTQAQESQDPSQDGGQAKEQEQEKEGGGAIRAPRRGRPLRKASPA